MYGRNKAYIIKKNHELSEEEDTNIIRNLQNQDGIDKNLRKLKSDFFRFDKKLESRILQNNFLKRK